MVNKELEKYNVVSKSLRESLLPFESWLDSVRAIEVAPPLEIAPPIKMENPDRIWLVPYPYLIPAYVEILQAKFPNKRTFYPDDVRTFTDRDVELWAKFVNARISSFITYCVSDSIVSLMDDNYDFGCIIHRTTGKIVRFSYTDVDGVAVGNIPVEIEKLMMASESARNQFSNPDLYDSIISNLDKNKMKHDAWYRFTSKRDMIFPDIMITENTKLTGEEIGAILAYMTTMISNHAKCMYIV